MAALPYMQLYVAEYLADTLHLNAAQHGAYLMILMNYWQRGKPLPDNDARLCVAAKMTAAEWKKNREVIAEFFTIEGGEWKHARVERDLAFVEQKQQQASNAGRASAQRKRNGRSTSVTTDVTTDVQRPQHDPFNHTDTDTDTDTEQNRTEAPLQPEMVAKRVQDLCRISGSRILHVITEQCRIELSRGIPYQDLVERMVAAREDFNANFENFAFTVSAERFFGEMWRDRKSWPWRKDFTQPAPSPKMIFANREGANA